MGITKTGDFKLYFTLVFCVNILRAELPFNSFSIVLLRAICKVLTVSFSNCCKYPESWFEGECLAGFLFFFCNHLFLFLETGNGLKWQQKLPPGTKGLKSALNHLLGPYGIKHQQSNLQSCLPLRIMQSRAE